MLYFETPDQYRPLSPQKTKGISRKNEIGYISSSNLCDHWLVHRIIGLFFASFRKYLGIFSDFFGNS